MKKNQFLTAALLCLAFLALATSPGKAQTILTNDIINTFDTGGQTNPFANSGSVHSWIYWFNVPGGNTPITNDVTMDANGNTNSGSLMIVSPFPTTNTTQNQYFGTFGNRFGYDLTTFLANLINYSDVSFDIKFDPNTPLSGSGNLGTIAVLSVSQDPTTFAVSTATLTNGMVIPAQARTNWVHMDVPINHSLAGITAVGGIGFNYNSFSGYPKFTVTNWIDNLIVHSAAGPPPPPRLSAPTTPLTGLNCISVVPGAGGQFNRYHLATVNSTGYSFVGQTSVTYSWNIKSFPQKTGTSFQQHFFICNGAPGPFDQAYDYNTTNCIFMTVQQNDSGVATFNFRYKTNEPGGNGMLFNGTDGNNGLTYPTNGSPKMPVASLTDSNGAVGTWSVTFAGTSNVTMTGPGGVSTNFVMNPVDAAIFADPVTLFVGGQPNNTTGGQTLVYGSFSASGSVATINDVFSTDTNIDSTTWNNLSNDTNGCILVPPGTSYELGWTLPDAGFTLQTAAALKGKSNSWTATSPLGTIQDNGKRVVLLSSSNLPSANQGYFSLVKRVYSQLVVLLDGETFAPGTPTGKTGTPITYNIGDTVNITVIAVDSGNFAVPGIIDGISISSTDQNFVPPLNQSLQNGQRTFQAQFGTSGTWTITATDVTNSSIPPGTSSPATVN